MGSGPAALLIALLLLSCPMLKEAPDADGARDPGGEEAAIEKPLQAGGGEGPDSCRGLPPGEMADCLERYAQ